MQDDRLIETWRLLLYFMVNVTATQRKSDGFKSQAGSELDQAVFPEGLISGVSKQRAYDGPLVCLNMNTIRTII